VSAIRIDSASSVIQQQLSGGERLFCSGQPRGGIRLRTAEYRERRWSLDECYWRPLDLNVRRIGSNAMLTSEPKRQTSTCLLCVSAALALVLILDACLSTTGPVPGSDKVHVTTNPSDVSACTAVGNIEVPGRTSNKEVQFRNRAVGLGANTAFVTVTVFGAPVDGIAYRCPQ
jgi:hypothetical protein